MLVLVCEVLCVVHLYEMKSEYYVAHCHVSCMHEFAAHKNVFKWCVALMTSKNAAKREGRETLFNVYEQ